MSDTLTTRQELFVSHALTGVAAAEAARRAGYSKTHAAKAAGKLMRSPKVKQAIDAGREHIRTTARYTLERAMQEAEDVICFAKLHKNSMAYFKAVEHRAKLSGLLIERIQAETIDLRAVVTEAQARRLRLVNPDALPTLEHSLED